MEWQKKNLFNTSLWLSLALTLYECVRILRTDPIIDDDSMTHIYSSGHKGMTAALHEIELVEVVTIGCRSTGRMTCGASGLTTHSELISMRSNHVLQPLLQFQLWFIWVEDSSHSFSATRVIISGDIMVILPFIWRGNHHIEQHLSVLRRLMFIFLICWSNCD